MENLDYRHLSIIDDFMYFPQSYLIVRIGFLRKVYGILSVQLVFTTLVGILMFWIDMPETIKSNSLSVILNLAATLIISITPLVKERSEYPKNYYILAAFTFFKSISIGLIASFESKTVVIQALIFTTVIVMNLTLNTLQSKRDFSAMGKFLPAVYLLFIFGAFLQLFFYNEASQLYLVGFGALLISGFIVYDTHMIIKDLSPEEYITGVNRLYFDIIYLFWDILRLVELRQNYRP